MRLEILCQDCTAVSRQLSELLRQYGLRWRRMELIADGGLHCELAAAQTADAERLIPLISAWPGVAAVKLGTGPTAPLRRWLDSLPEPILMLDEQGAILWRNAAARQNAFPTDEPLSTVLSAPGWPLTAGETYALRWQDRRWRAEWLPDQQNEKISAGLLILQPETAVRGTASSAETPSLVAVSPQMREVVTQLSQAARLNAPLLIVGETGTGKELIARACHQQSARCGQPFLALNCAALPEAVAESELFGHRAGAYPNALESKKGFFEQANGGTVLLDEPGEMSLALQAKLLRFMNDGTFRRVGEEQEVHVDVRVICATQQDLAALVRAGRFREDLYYRLNVLKITVPPLRERPLDILPLAHAFLDQFAAEQGLPPLTLPQAVADRLLRFAWPGNVRQLRNTLYQALLQTEGKTLTAQALPLPDGEPLPLFSDAALFSGSLDEMIRRFECAVLQRLYHDYPSTRKLAKRLGVSHTAIANKLREYGLQKRDESEATAEQEQ